MARQYDGLLTIYKVLQGAHNEEIKYLKAPKSYNAFPKIHFKYRDHDILISHVSISNNNPIFIPIHISGELGEYLIVVRSPYEIIERINEILNSRTYLLLGGYPAPPAQGRQPDNALYSNENVYIADIEDVRKTDPFRSRYFKLDFNDLKQIKEFRRQHPNRFDVVLFDWSTFKFFNKDETFQQRLCELLNLTRVGGTFIIENPTGGEFQGVEDREAEIRLRRQRIQDFLNTVTNISYTFTRADQANPNSILQQVYAAGPDTELVVIHVRGEVRLKSIGGKRTRRKRKQRKTRKQRR